MKKIISYYIMSLLFFNILFIFFYYFKIVNYLYIDFINLNKFLNIIVTNLFIIVIDSLIIIIYKLFFYNKFSFLLTICLGSLIGTVISIFLLNKDYELNDYLGILSFFIINTLFIIYSLYFEKHKEKVFN